jgi:hypothetical protein
VADIFISYTHKDNKKLSAEQQGWIDSFHEALTQRLDMFCGRETDVWRDVKIRGVDVLTPEIESTLRKSKLLISVVSPGYLNSDWCKKEIRIFGDTFAGSAAKDETYSRIVKVIKMPVTPRQEAELPVLRDVIGYPFFQVGERGVPLELDARPGYGSFKEFTALVNELAYHLRSLLEELGASDSSGPPIAEPSGVAIYLAEGSFDVAADVARLRRELRQFGHELYPTAPLPATPEFEDRVREALSKCAFSIHAVGKNYAVGGDPRISRTEVQLRLAQEEAKQRPEFRILPWFDCPKVGQLPVTDPRNVLARTLERVENAELLILPLEELKTTIQDLLAAGLVAPKVVASPDPTARKVYLIRDAVDEEPARAIEAELVARNFEILPAPTATSENPLRQHKDNLKACDAAIIFVQAATDDWLLGRSRDLRQALGYRTQSMFIRAAMLAEPVEPHLEVLEETDIEVWPIRGPIAPVVAAFANHVAEASGTQ